MIDGEIVIATDSGLDFEALQLRLHPAVSRVRMLAEQTPASVHRVRLVGPRRRRLHRPTVQRAPRRPRRSSGGLRPVVPRHAGDHRPGTAQRWFEEFEGAGLDGVIAKPLTITYQPDKRVMFKIKHVRTADCVVAGYRVHKSGDDAIGSLLLGLYKDDGTLASVGVIGAFPMAERRRAVHRIAAARHHFRCAPVELGRPHGRRPHTA